MTDKEKEIKNKILELAQQAVTHDNELRTQYQVGDKFRFIRDRLQRMLSHVQENLQLLQDKNVVKQEAMSENEVKVYIYLFNSQGITLQTWHKMVRQDVFYEYSVNRPVYGELAHIQSFMRSRSNKAQHAYLTILVNKDKIIKVNEPAKDAVGNPLIKIKEGSFKIERLISFMHNDQEYVLNLTGELVKKTSEN